MTTPFPLLRLPYPVLMLALEQMPFIERFSLSILSKQVRIFLKLLKMKCKQINLKHEYGAIRMEVLFDNLVEKFRLEMFTSGYVEFKYREDALLCNTSGVPPMNYAISIMDVMHCKSIHQFRIVEIPERNILPLLVNLPKIYEVVVDETYNSSSPDSLLQKMLNIVLPVSSAVTISAFVVKPKYLREILKGNLDSVTVGNHRVGNTANYGLRFSLNALRITNAKALDLYNVILNSKDMNRFFKLWMKKKCDPRLEYLRARKYRDGNEDRLLKGLNAVGMPIRTDRTFRVLGNVEQLRSDEETTTEFDITRVDGRQATIRFGESDEYNFIDFYVWPESPNDTTDFEPDQSSLTEHIHRIVSRHGLLERF
ncbi:hypothetical protein GCK72_021234 [Caenorhabditis remanei]|uniref:F-box domain-containing protein n=1 Tax=Caenorhabditis remanei TaxID=31234 RepID=A0A6A5GJ89_CAERE|nr:hypothetical protein GCK72_021234 [Caenorhabditis remanei]KAF1754671.1 hypothetical protein GCK72_021234 [Caenorhabditis remanei]